MSAQMTSATPAAPAPEAWCRNCGEWRPVAAFYDRFNARVRVCATCRQARHERQQPTVPAIANQPLPEPQPRPAVERRGGQQSRMERLGPSQPQFWLTPAQLDRLILEAAQDGCDASTIQARIRAAATACGWTGATE